MITVDKQDHDDQGVDVYEAPRLVAVGNLRDLVAGGLSSHLCDGAIAEKGPDSQRPDTGGCA